MSVRIEFSISVIEVVYLLLTIDWFGCKDWVDLLQSSN
jgi:hypothetical protein